MAHCDTENLLGHVEIPPPVRVLLDKFENLEREVFRQLAAIPRAKATYNPFRKYKEEQAKAAPTSPYLRRNLNAQGFSPVVPLGCLRMAARITSGVPALWVPARVKGRSRVSWSATHTSIQRWLYRRVPRGRSSGAPPIVVLREREGRSLPALLVGLGSIERAASDGLAQMIYCGARGFLPTDGLCARFAFRVTQSLMNAA